MNHFQLGILRIIFLVAGGALLVFRKASRKATLAFLVVGAIALFSWTRFGELHGNGSYVHRWEQFHFYFSAKYLKEIRYDDLYKAVFMADREGSPHPLVVTQTRDLTTFEEVPIDAVMGDQAEIRARFSDARWEEFKSDWLAMRSRGAPWGDVLKDHGNTGSPAWALVAAPIAAVVPCTETGEKILALVDVGLLLLLFVSMLRAFGARAGAVGIWVFACVPVSFDYLFGSFLRWDWLFAVGMSLCAWKRGRHLTAGAFLGYAICSKLFPVFFGLGLAAKAVQELARTRKIPWRFVRFGAGVALVGVLSVGVSSAVFGGPQIWRDYAARIDVANHEKFYGNQYSFQTVFLQVEASTLAELTDFPFTPPEIKQSRRDVDMATRCVDGARGFCHRPAVYLGVRLAFTLLLLWLALRGGEIEALAMGPFFVFLWLTVNAYYWNMLMFPALAWGARRLFDGRKLAPLLGLHGLLVALYFYQHTNHGYAEGYFVACLMLLLFAVWAASEAWGPMRAWFRR